MILSVKNFKSIKSVSDFRIEDVNILVGVNSSGKSSLTQSLLLLKQTVESDSKEVIRLNSPYVYADGFSDLVYGKQKQTVLEYDIEFEYSEILDKGNLCSMLGVDTFDRLGLHVAFIGNGTIHVQELAVKLYDNGNTEETFLDVRRNKSSNAKDVYQVTAKNGKVLGVDNDVSKGLTLKSCNIDFTNFFPIFGECKAAKSAIRFFSFPLLKVFKATIDSFFSNIYYIGPIRVKPALLKTYDMTPSMERVDADGDNTRYILQEKKDLKVDGDRTLAESVKEWVCDRLGLAESIETTKDANKFYRTQLQNGHNQKIDLCHMGFGISQILPILVQGLILPENGLLIVEDPCVHMHPSVQAKMMDFFLELTESKGRKAMIETHSDHIITRLRRRVAEGCQAGKINLRFVEQTSEGSEYLKIDITDQGAFGSELPKGFLDTQDDDFRAILKSRLR